MKNKIISLQILFLLIVFAIQAQNSSIEKLNILLFPENVKIETMKSFTWEGEKYQVTARNFDLKNKDISKVLFDIREKEAINLIDDLIAIQKKHETYFLKEWEKSWRIAHRLFDENYDVLMNLELTINYLYVLKTIDSEINRYLYFKNMLYRQWIEGDNSRSQDIHFFSDYIKNRWNGACLASHFCTPSLIIERANVFKEGILQDLNTFRSDKLSDREYIYYLITLGKAAINIEDSRVEDIYINRIDEFDSLILSVENQVGREIWIYNILCARARDKGLSFLLEDLSSKEILKIQPFILNKICSSTLGLNLFKNRILSEIKLSKGKIIQREYIKEYLRFFSIKSMVSDNLSNIIDKQNMDLIDNKLRNQ